MTLTLPKHVSVYPDLRSIGNTGRPLNNARLPKYVSGFPDLRSLVEMVCRP